MFAVRTDYFVDFVMLKLMSCIMHLSIFSPEGGRVAGIPGDYKAKTVTVLMNLTDKFGTGTLDVSARKS